MRIHLPLWQVVLNLVLSHQEIRDDEEVDQVDFEVDEGEVDSLEEVVEVEDEEADKDVLCIK